MEKNIIKSKEEVTEKTKEMEKIKTKQYFSIPIEVLERNSSQACICYMYLLYKSNLGNIVSNTSLAKEMKCSTRTISRLIEELAKNNCINIFYISKSVRYIYPVYILPIIYRTDDVKQEYEKEVEQPKIKQQEKIEIGKYNRIKITKEEYVELLKEIKKKELDILIEKLNEYLELYDNNKYKNHYLLIKKAYKEHWYYLNENNNGGFQEL